jgi:DNA processing protein
VTGACPECVRRCRLLAELGPLLDYRSGRPQDLAELLGLDDQDLIEALAGRRRGQLREWHASREAGHMEPCRGGIQLCRHDEGYPAALREPWAPAVLSVLGGRERFAELIGRPAVGFLDTSEASDYGRAMAASLARGLAAAGVTIVAGVRGPLGGAAHDGASRAGSSLAVLGEGLASVRGRAEATVRLVLDGGCAVSELPWRSAARKWGPVACERIVTGLGAATVVVESRGEERELWAARLGGPLGAVPGMVTNPLASGPHRLLAGGARLLRGPSEVLALLHEAGGEPPVATPIAPDPRLPPRVRGVLELVGAGIDTPEGLAAAATEGRLPGCRDRGSPLELMAALGELEAIGALSRTEEGRYVRRDPARDHWL